MNAFIDEHRARCGVEPICSALQVAPSAYRRHAARHRNPALLAARAQRDASLLAQVQRVYDQNLRVYGADKVWRQLRREGTTVARCTVERLMRLRGLQGVRRGKSVRTTVPAPKAACPQDRVNRQLSKLLPITPGTKITGMVRSGTMTHMAKLLSGAETCEFHRGLPRFS